MSSDEDAKLLKRLAANDPSVTVLDGISSVNEETAKALAHNTFVETIHLQKAVVDDAFLKAVGTVSHLKHLQLRRAGLSTASAKTLCTACPNLERLQTLDLSGNVKLGPRGCKQLAELLQKMRSLTDLDLSNVSMGHYGSQAIADHLPTSLQKLNLSHNAMGHDGFWKLAESLVLLEQMSCLDLSYNNFLDDGCLEMAKHTIPAQKLLTNLNLAGNAIGDTGMQALATALAGSSIQELNLKDNQITDVGATALAEHSLSTAAAQDVESGTSSDDDDDDDDEENSIPEIAPISQLKRIDLSSNRIGNAGCNALAVALSQGAHVVQALDLSDNAIGDEGAGAFVELLDDMPGLSELDLTNNIDMTEARTRILDMLLKHRSVASHRRAEEPTERSLETSVDHSETEHTQTTTAHHLGLMDNSISISEQKLVEEENAIEEGHKLLLERLSNKQNTTVPIPLPYATHLTENFSAELVVQHGAFGRLYTANGDDDSSTLLLVRHLMLAPPGPMAVAREAVLEELTELSHENILKPVAYTQGPSSYCFLYNTANRRTLTDLLQDEDQISKMKWKVRLGCLNSVAQALAYLHSKKNTFHGDVCPHNIFVQVSNTKSSAEKEYDKYAFSSVQLIDGGLSRLLATDRSQFVSGDTVFGSRGYRCPRYERGSCQYDTASDMFAFGMVVAEVTTGRLQRSKGDSTMAWDAYYDVTGIVTKHATIPVDTKAGPVPKTLIEMIGKILLSCASPLVETRPTSGAVAAVLSQASAAYSKLE